MCPLDNDPPLVYVSYDRCGLTENVPVKKIDENGNLLRSTNCEGKVTYKRCAKGLSMRSGMTAGVFHSLSKSPINTHFQLSNDLSGGANIEKTYLTSSKPCKAEAKTEFNIKVGAHRAFDVDDKEQSFVVVEEAKLPDMCRKVLLYQRSKRAPVATYTPPTPAFQPSDVCFYTLGHQHVLLVSDELCDAIHVVHVQDGVMTFLRYLAPGCPLLIQPTAMNENHSTSQDLSESLENHSTSQDLLESLENHSTSQDLSYSQASICMDYTSFQDLFIRLRTLIFTYQPCMKLRVRQLSRSCRSSSGPCREAHRYFSDGRSVCRVGVSSHPISPTGFCQKGLS